MPGAVWPNEGLCDLLNYLLGRSLSGVPDLTLALWTNNVVPVPGTVLADLTLATWAGYSPVVLTRSLWSAAVLVGDRAVSQWGTVPITWIATTGPPETVYGYVMYDAGAGVIRFVQRFEPEDVKLVNPGGVFSIVPRVDLATNYAPEYADSGAGAIEWWGDASLSP